MDVIVFPAISDDPDCDNVVFGNLSNNEGVKSAIVKLVTQQCESCLQFNMVDEKFLYPGMELIASAADDFGKIGILLWKAIHLMLTNSATSTQSVVDRGEAFTESAISCMTAILKVIIARFPATTENFLNSLLSDQQPEQLQRHKQRASTSRLASVYCQIVEAVQKLIEKNNKSVIRNGHGVSHSLMKMLVLVTELMFTKNGGKKECSWELKECCQWLWKSVQNTADYDIVSSKLLLSLTLSCCSLIQNCHLPAKIAYKIYLELSDEVTMQQEQTKRPQQVPIQLVTRENAEALSIEVNNFVTQWLNNITWCIKASASILSSATKTWSSGGIGSSELLNSIDKSESTLCRELTAVTVTVVKLLNCAFVREQSFCVTVNNCYAYHINMHLYLKNVLYRIQHVTKNRSSPLTSELHRLIKTSQAPMKDAVHNALEHAVGHLWDSTENDSASRRPKQRKRKRNSTEALSEIPNGGTHALVKQEPTTADGMNQDGGDEEELVGNEKGKAKVGKETKNIPQLVFAMEQMELTTFRLCKYLGLDSTQFISSVNLRDFRIRDDTTTTDDVRTADQQSSTNQSRDSQSEVAGPSTNRRARTN